MLAGCGLFGPDGGDRSVTIELPFCGESAIPITWASIKRDGGNWTTLDAEDGRAEVTAKGRVSVAYGGDSETRIYSGTADELSQVRCFRDAVATRVLQGSVRDVPAQDRFIVSVGPASVETTPFAVFIAEGPHNLVARTRNATTGEPRQVITRLGIDPPTGTEIAVLDFSSNEARNFLSANANVMGASSAFFTNSFQAWGSSHELTSGNVGLSPVRHFAVPEALLGPDDYHTLEIRDVAAGLPNDLVYYYRRSHDVTLTFGPRASTPTGAVLKSAPCTYLQATLPSQPAYPSFAIVRFFASDGSFRNVEVGVTKAFLGATPATWTLEIPEILRPGGSCLFPANLTAWGMAVMPHDGRLALFLGGKGLDGEQRRWSTVFWNSP